MSFQESYNKVWSEPAGKVAVGTTGLLVLILSVVIGSKAPNPNTQSSSLPNTQTSSLLPTPSVSLGSVNPKEVDLIQADSATYYSKPAVVKAIVSPSNYFNYAFMDTEPTHYSFQIDGDSSYIHAYGERTKFKDLFDYLSQKGGKAPVEVTIQTSPSHGSNDIWTLLSWKKI